MLFQQGRLPMIMGGPDDGFLDDIGGVDTPSGVNTTESLAIGGAVEGAVGVVGDSDLYRVTLTAGVHYRFVLSGNGDTPLTDPFLRLLRADTTLISTDDDSGPGHDAALGFTATESGTYYLLAQAFSTETGGYRLTAEIAPAQDPLKTIDWGTQLASGEVLIYFAKIGETFGGASATRSWTADEKAAALAAGATYSAVTNVTFTAVETAGAATMVLVLDNTLSAAGRMTTPGGAQAFGVFNPTGSWTASSLYAGGSAFQTLVHEFGHALGLAHPHDPGGFSEVMEGVADPIGSYGVSGLNQGVYTVMSYNDGFPGGNGRPLVSSNYGFAATPMALDIAVVQQKYGAVAHNSGDTTYYLTSAGGSYIAIWDTGGIDTIIANRSYGVSVGVRIDLRAATLLGEAGGGGYLSSPMPRTDGGYTIAAGVEIENAVGSDGNDTLIGNALDNVLDGGRGDDLIEGGDGTDTAVYETGATVSLAITGPQDTGAGMDTLVSIENLTGALNLDDRLTGDGLVNVLKGRGGDDVLDGGAGGDVLDGGDGFDTATYASATAAVHVDLTLAGPQATLGSGDDTLISIERLIGSAFNDILKGDSAANRIAGGLGDDVIDGAGGFDFASYADAPGPVTVNLSLSGPQDTGHGLDTLINIEGVEGSASDDALMGDDGDNILIGNAGSDQLIGGGGVDVASFRNASAGVSVSLMVIGRQETGQGFDLLASIEGLEGSAFDDVLVGDAGDNLFLMTKGHDIITGGDGVDTVSFQNLGGGSIDLWDYGSGPYNYRLSSIENATGSDFEDWLGGNNLANVLMGLGGADRLSGQGGDDILLGGAGDDILNGGEGADQLYGQAGADTLYDGGGTATRAFMYGGAGSDTYYVESSLGGPLDLVYEGGDNPDLMAGADDVDIIISGGTFFWDYYGVAEIMRGGGQLVGGTNDQTIEGGDGTDLICAYGGSNRVDAGWGTDAISFGLYGLDESFNGANTLVMKPRSGIDYVYEFESGVDKIDLTAFHFGITGQQVLDQAVNVDQPGTDNDYCYFYLTTTFGVENYVAFIGLLSNQLQAADFLT